MICNSDEFQTHRYCCFYSCFNGSSYSNTYFFIQCRRIADTFINFQPLLTIMLKPILIFIFGILFFQSAKAQKQDTLLYYMKSQWQIATNKDSAKYFLFIMSPDSSDKSTYPISEFYPNGKLKLISKSNTNKFNALEFEGPCIEFFNTGKRKSITNYTKRKLTGSATYYYPNGKLYKEGLYNKNSHLMLITCKDSAGSFLTENGQGRWIDFDESFKRVTQEGSVKDSLENGEWDIMPNDTTKFKTTYQQGLVISSTDNHTPLGEDYIYWAVDIEPKFSQKDDAFSRFLTNNIRYPDVAKRNNIQGKVFVAFVIEKDGKVSNIKILRSPDEPLSEECLRIMKLSPSWIPGKENGTVVRTQFTVPISFTLTNN